MKWFKFFMVSVLLHVAALATVVGLGVLAIVAEQLLN